MVRSVSLYENLIQRSEYPKRKDVLPAAVADEIAAHVLDCMEARGYTYPDSGGGGGFGWQDAIEDFAGHFWPSLAYYQVKRAFCAEHKRRSAQVRGR